MHNNSLIIKEAEEQTSKILGIDYLKVDINKIADDLCIDTSTKIKLKETLKKFPMLFGGGFDELKVEKRIF